MNRWKWGLHITPAVFALNHCSDPHCTLNKQHCEIYYMQAVSWWRAVKGAVKVTSEGVISHWGGGVWLQRAYVTGKYARERFPPFTFSFAFILMVEIKISCCNYCSARRPNSAKSIASHPSGAIECIWHQLFLYMFQWAAVDGNGTRYVIHVCWSTRFLENCQSFLRLPFVSLQ